MHPSNPFTAYQTVYWSMIFIGFVPIRSMIIGPDSAERGRHWPWLCGCADGCRNSRCVRNRRDLCLLRGRGSSWSFQSKVFSSAIIQRDKWRHTPRIKQKNTSKSGAPFTNPPWAQCLITWMPSGSVGPSSCLNVRYALCDGPTSSKSPKLLYLSCSSTSFFPPQK